MSPVLSIASVDDFSQGMTSLGGATAPTSSTVHVSPPSAEVDNCGA